ncbi:MAG: hypothetical protein ACYTEQ_30305 [Planctomycetota bacterium]|jgi:hypothetical protein
MTQQRNTVPRRPADFELLLVLRQDDGDFGDEVVVQDKGWCADARDIPMSLGISLGQCLERQGLQAFDILAHAIQYVEETIYADDDYGRLGAAVRKFLESRRSVAPKDNLPLPEG